MNASPETNARRVRDMLDAIYGRFSAPTPRSIEGCPCCIGERNVDVLLGKPLRDLTGDELWPYVSGAFLTLGSERDFRYLFPRILELAVYEPSALPDAEVVLGKLKLAKWEAWRAEERRAVEELIDAWFDLLLAQDISGAEGGCVGWEAEGVLCGAARAGLDISPWLRRLGEPSAEPVRAALAQMYSEALVSESLPETSFWEDAPEGWRAFSEMIGAEARRG